MNLGDVIKKERTKVGLSTEEIAGRLSMTMSDYESVETGQSEAEAIGPLLAALAVELRVPTSRLISRSGRSEDAEPCGPLIREHRLERGLSESQMADAVGVNLDEYKQIEAGTSKLETYAPIFLRFAEVIDQPVFNLFYPCGIAFGELEDYP